MAVGGGPQRIYFVSLLEVAASSEGNLVRTRKRHPSPAHSLATGAQTGCTPELYPSTRCSCGVHNLYNHTGQPCAPLSSPGGGWESSDRPMGSKLRGDLCSLLSQVKASWGRDVPKKKWPGKTELRTASGFPQVPDEDSKGKPGGVQHP